MNERPSGTFTRQLLLGETLDTEHIEGNYNNSGVLTLTISLSEAAKPRKVAVTANEDAMKPSAAS